MQLPLYQGTVGSFSEREARVLIYRKLWDCISNWHKERICVTHTRRYYYGWRNPLTMRWYHEMVKSIQPELSPLNLVHRECKGMLITVGINHFHHVRLWVWFLDFFNTVDLGDHNERVERAFYWIGMYDYEAQRRGSCYNGATHLCPTMCWVALIARTIIMWACGSGEGIAPNSYIYILGGFAATESAWHVDRMWLRREEGKGKCWSRRDKQALRAMKTWWT